MILESDMSDLTVCTINYNTSRYIRFQDRILRSLAADGGYKRLILDTSPSSEIYALTGLPETDIASVDTGTRYGSETHGFGVNWLIEHANTEYALLIDPDAVLLRQNWDTLLKAELSDTCVAIGSPYNPNHGRRRHQDFPNAICFFFRVKPLQEIHVNWEPLSFRWRKPLIRVVHSRLTRYVPFLAFNDFEMGYRVPGAFQKHGYTAKHFDFILPHDGTAKLLRPGLNFEEYHWRGQVIATHQRRSQQAFDSMPHSQEWVSAVQRHLVFQCVDTQEVCPERS